MEKLSGPILAYLIVEEKALAFSDADDVVFTVFPQENALVPGNTFVVDIYAADDHTHPHGHAGWWEYPLMGQKAVHVRIVRNEDGLTIFFNETPASNFWKNEHFCLNGRKLVLHLVVRAWRSTTILFNDPLNLYPDSAALKADVRKELCEEIPAETPIRWFVWPSSSRVLLIFGSLRSRASRIFCEQLSAMLRHNSIPFQIYAHSYDSDQRMHILPVEYLRQQARKEDTAFFIFAEGGPVLPLVADLPCRKVLYQMHLPDYRRYQAFDAEFARKLAEVEEQRESMLRFDGICYESEYTQNMVASVLKKFVRSVLQENWDICSGVLSRQTDNVIWGETLQKSIPAVTETVLCSMPEDIPDFIPRRQAVTVMHPQIPPTLGVFPPVLWRKNWESITAEPCHVPERFILSVGSFRPDKHHEETLRIFAAVAERDPTVGLVIVGWAQVNGYWDYIRFLGEHTYKDISHRIIFLQSCRDAQLLWLYKHAQLYFTTCSYEGYSGSVMDALYFNLPIVARETESIEMLLGASGLQFDTRTKLDVVAEDIVRLCNDHDFRKSVLRNQQEYAVRKDYIKGIRNALYVFHEMICPKKKDLS